jgi:hypothetical protein
MKEILVNEWYSFVEGVNRIIKGGENNEQS